MVLYSSAQEGHELIRSHVLELPGVGSAAYPGKPIPNAGLGLGDRANDHVAIGSHFKFDFAVGQQARLFAYRLRYGDLALAGDFHSENFLTIWSKNLTFIANGLQCKPAVAELTTIAT